MIGIIGGVFGAVSAWLFIHLIRLAQGWREAFPALIFILPFAGLFIRYLYLNYKKGVFEAPILAISVFLTHLGGGSAGREGAVIHLARILAHSIGKFLHFEERQIRKLIIAAVGSGFGVALGAPIAGFFFGFEENRHPFLRPRTLFHSALAAGVAHWLLLSTGTEHFKPASITIPQYSLTIFAFTAVAGIVFGFMTVLYHRFKRFFEHRTAQHSPLLAGFLGGGILFALYCVFGLKEFQGLGEAGILQAQEQVVPLATAFQKMLVTIVTLGSGFQGGEFFPLGYMGSSLGSSFGFIHAESARLYAALGFTVIYGAATRTPFACTLLAGELFGWKILPFAAIATYLASLINTRLAFRSDLDS
jgi:H+/Cl- antiporter ClcA